MTPERAQAKRRRYRGATFLVGAYLAFARPVLADEPTPTELAVARRLFQEASELEAEGEWAIAASKLREAIQIKDTPGLRFHLAHCEERLGLLVEAGLDYDRARDILAAGAKAPDVEALLEPARKSLEQRMPTLVIVIPAGVPDLAVSLNKRQLARSILGRPAPVNPGRYTIEVTAPGYEPFVREVVIKEGERSRVTAELARRRAPPGPPARVEPAPSPKLHSEPAPLDEDTDTKSYVLIAESAFTAASLGVGIGFLLAKNGASDRVRDAQDDLEDESCKPTPADEELAARCAVLDDAIADHATAQRWFTAGFVGAGVGAASIALTFLLWPSREGTPHVTASPTRDGAWFAVTGTF